MVDGFFSRALENLCQISSTRRVADLQRMDCADLHPSREEHRKPYPHVCRRARPGTRTALAAAPMLEVGKSVTIHAPVATVWAKVKDFVALNAWHPAVAKDDIVAGADDHPGAQRKLTLGNCDRVHEKLLSFDDAHHRFGYTILGGVLPVSDYHSTQHVIVIGKDSSKVTWSGTFKRKDTGDHPSADSDDKAATTAIAGVYQSGLDNLEKLLEARQLRPGPPLAKRKPRQRHHIAWSQRSPSGS